MVKDFIGQPLTVGGFVVSGGKGNTAAEYGMILHEVVTLAPKVKLLRLTVSYPVGQGKTEATTRVVTVENMQKYVVVSPPQAVLDLFYAAKAGTASQAQQTLVGKWVHGQTQVF